MADERLAYITKEVLPSLKEKRKEIKNITFEPIATKPGGEHFQSIAIFGDIVIEYEEGKDDGKTQTRNKDKFSHMALDELNIDEKVNGTRSDALKERLGVVIKMQICDKIAMAWTNGGLNFFNEIFFYKDILPYFRTKVDDINEMFPEIVHGHFSDSDEREQDIIILRNLNENGYRIASDRVFLSLEHILLALNRLGKFHACSYIMKSLDNDHFMAKVNTLKLTKTWIRSKNNQVYGHWAKCAERYVTYLETVPTYRNLLTNLKQYLNNLNENLPNIFEPNEKMSVLCHGDFNRNNMFFKYVAKNGLEIGENVAQDETKFPNESSPQPDPKGGDDDTKDDTETPIDVKFFDLADVIYGTPVFDLAFFLFMNTTQPMRTAHWDDMIRTYHNSIQTEANKFENVIIPSYEDICEEFKGNCMMAFLVCSFFLPIMMEEKRPERSEWSEKSYKENMESILNVGGHRATVAVAEILMHMLDKGFI